MSKRPKRSFNSVQLLSGGQSIDATESINRMPLFGRGRSIIPVRAEMRYTSERPGAPITLFVLAGSDDSFDFYEDHGVSCRYERGKYSRTPTRYDAVIGTLRLEPRSGSFPGMSKVRKFQVRCIRDGAQAPAALDAPAAAAFEHTGNEAIIPM